MPASDASTEVAKFTDDARGGKGTKEPVRTLNFKHPLPFPARSISFGGATNAVRTPGSKAHEGEFYGDWYREVV